METKIKGIASYYNEFGYTVYTVDETHQPIHALYDAGNNKNSSAYSDSVPLDNPNCVPLAKMKQYAIKTGKEIAKDKKMKFLYSEYEQIEVA